MKKSKPYLLLAAVVLIAGLIVTVYNYQSAKADAFPGLVAQIGVNNTSGTTTSIALIPNVSTSIFATSTCSARIVTTKSADILLSFYDGAPTLNSFNGHLQTASTTVAYSSGQYGCGLVRAYALVGGGVASTTINITETR